MIARGRVEVEAVGGGDVEARSRLRCLRSEGPLVLRPAAAGVVHLVGGAGGPLGGDHLRLEVEVGPGAFLELRTVGASVALPGRGASVVEIVAHIGEAGELRWLPEPTVAASGCRHEVSARIVGGFGSKVTWREELVRGRHGESGGAVSSGLSVDLAGQPLLRHHVEVDGGLTWASPAVGGGYRCAGSLLVVDPAFDTEPLLPAIVGPAAAVLALRGPGAQVLALAEDSRALRLLLDEGQALVSRDPAPSSASTLGAAGASLPVPPAEASLLSAATR